MAGPSDSVPPSRQGTIELIDVDHPSPPTTAIAPSHSPIPGSLRKTRIDNSRTRIGISQILGLSDKTTDAPPQQPAPVYGGSNSSIPSQPEIVADYRRRQSSTGNDSQAHSDFTSPPRTDNPTTQLRRGSATGQNSESSTVNPIPQLETRDEMAERLAKLEELVRQLGGQDPHGRRDSLPGGDNAFQRSDNLQESRLSQGDFNAVSNDHPDDGDKASTKKSTVGQPSHADTLSKVTATDPPQIPDADRSPVVAIPSPVEHPLVGLNALFRPTQSPRARSPAPEPISIISVSDSKPDAQPVRPDRYDIPDTIVSDSKIDTIGDHPSSPPSPVMHTATLSPTRPLSSEVFSTQLDKSDVLVAPGIHVADVRPGTESPTGSHASSGQHSRYWSPGQISPASTRPSTPSSTPPGAHTPVLTKEQSLGESPKQIPKNQEMNISFARKFANFFGGNPKSIKSPQLSPVLPPSNSTFRFSGLPDGKLPSSMSQFHASLAQRFNDGRHGKTDFFGRQLQSSSTAAPDRTASAVLPIPTDSPDQRGDPTICTDTATTDWNVWETVVKAGPKTLVQSRPADLSKAINAGVPSTIRGVIWQYLAGVDDQHQLLRLYAVLIERSNAALALSRRSTESTDSYRTPRPKAPYDPIGEYKSAALTSKLVDAAFALEPSPELVRQLSRRVSRGLDKTEFFGIKDAPSLQDLHDVCLAYALFDPEVGNPPGISSIVMPLLYHMPPCEAFAVLIRLMIHYRLRDLVLTGTPGLMLNLFCLDRLLASRDPMLAAHFVHLGIISNEYATPWFFTLFCAQFPLQLVCRIYDLIFLYGLDKTILEVGLSALRHNRQAILDMNAKDPLLVFLRDGLLNHYIDTKFRPRDVVAASLFSRSPPDLYRNNDFIDGSIEQEVSKTELWLFTREWTSREASMRTLTDENAKLLEETVHMKALEKERAGLVTEVEETTKMISSLVDKLERLEDKNEQLSTSNEMLKDLVDRYTTDSHASTTEAMERLRAEFEANFHADLAVQAQRNNELMAQKTALERQLQVAVSDRDRAVEETDKVKGDLDDWKQQFDKFKAQATTRIGNLEEALVSEGAHATEEISKLKVKLEQEREKSQGLEARLSDEEAKGAALTERWELVKGMLTK